VGSIIFFVCLYLYIWLFIEPRLIYHCFGTFIPYPAFSVGLDFLISSLSHPGGVIEYAGGFLSQLYYFSWLGALVITATAWLMYLAATICVRHVADTSRQVRLLTLRRPQGYEGQAGKRLKIICYIPAIMLLVIHNRYDSHLTTFLSLLATLWFTVIYSKLSLRSSFARASVFLVEFCALYYLACGASFVFAFLATTYEIFAGRRRFLQILFPAAAIGAYLALRYIFDLETKIIYLPLLASQLTYGPWIKHILISIYFFFPLVIFIAGLWQWIYNRKTSTAKSKMGTMHKPSMVRKLRQFFQNNKSKLALETVLPAAILITSILVSFDGTKKKLVQVDFFAHQNKWSEVLRTAQRIRPEAQDVCCIHDVEQALYHTGRLGDEMFRYPQDIDTLILFTAEGKSPAGRIFMKRSQLFLKLGHVGPAEKDAFEYMEVIGNHPLILERLAQIKVVKGQVEAAKVFLSALSKDLIYGHRGREMLRRLEDDPELANDKIIQYIRSVAPDKASVSNTLDDEFFTQLLEKNSNNKLAFEYMMAFYLLTKQVDKVAANISRLNDLGYEKLPQHYEEALVIYMTKYKKTELPVPGWLPRSETIERAKTIGGLYNFYRGNEQFIRKALGPDFNNSYFLYYLFGATKVKI
jgi:hypothetical protein